MIGLLEAVADYENSKDALGYTVYYYLTNMEADKLTTSKLISVTRLLRQMKVLQTENTLMSMISML